MSEFPGYMSSKAVRKQVNEQKMRDAITKAREHKAVANNKYEYVKGAIPLLEIHAKDSSYPVEVKIGRFMRRMQLQRGWVVASIYYESTEASFSNFGEATTNLQVLTNTGLLGFAREVDRGITALEMLGDPKAISPEQFMGPVHDYSIIYGIAEILSQAGVEYRPDTINP